MFYLETKINQYFTAWVKMDTSSETFQMQNKINVDFSKWYFNFLLPKSNFSILVVKTINKRDVKQNIIKQSRPQP